MRYEKLSPDLAAAAEDFHRSGRAGLSAHRHAMAVVTPEPPVVTPPTVE